ncbi:MAG: alanine--tRNA ligase [Firmicutes bacterium]|nr:alanine--tRNA ligase [Bacillota bacterium]
MEWTGLNELREKFLAFYEGKGHLRMPSFSLIPQGDPSLLLINSGMAPLKKFFTGEITPPSARACTCQKCVRTSDIENVGKTARHGSYFEMLGNFSFGEYFKREAIAWAWEFVTQVMEMDPERVYCSVFYESDDNWDSEAWDIWTKEIGRPERNMARLGREDNFWEHGAGPCGPCSEIYYDRGEQYSCGSPDCAPGCECDRYVEFYNLVFTQFDSDGAGNYTPLARKNIDTGLGLERLGCICQGVDQLFEVDTVRRIRGHISNISGVAYHAGAASDVSLRVITDHIRATTMMISDGVLPSNEGRGYVLRRLLRRAARHGRLLGIDRPFLSEVAVTVIAENERAYPVLAEKKEFILKVIANEEENFSRTIDAGLSLLNRMIAECKSAGGKNATPTAVLSGADAFKLSDTYGFPIDLTKEILEENNMTVDEDAYKALAIEQRERSRAARKEAGGWDSDEDFDTRGLPPTKYLGYEQPECEAKILAIYDIDGKDGESVDSTECRAVLVLDQTVCYAESGGQCGDLGVIANEDTETYFSITDETTKTAQGVYLHTGEIVDGEKLCVGDTVRMIIHPEYQPAIRANHTAAHLLHSVLRKVLGTHVEQAGQSVTQEHVRFDFTHFAALTSDELTQVEGLVNAAIRQAIPVKTEVLPIEEAKARGAMALFGEKYGDTVRMVSIEGVKNASIELCGGTHAQNTSNLGAFLITSEGSVASGVRRIEAVTRDGVERYHQAQKQKLQERNDALLKQIKEKDKQIAQLGQKLSNYAVRDLLQNAASINGVRFVTGALSGDLRQACDIVKQSDEAVVALFAAITDKGTLQLAAVAAPKAVKAGAHAGNLVRAAAQAAGGSGGGKPDSAMAGGRDASRLDEALAVGKAALEGMVR